MGCRTRELREKSVITCDGRCLGNICDFEVDACSGRIDAIFVPADCGGLFFGRGEDIRIPWDKISRIGEDAILVEYDVSDGDCICTCDRPPRKKRWFT